jgi:hypothetical protein
MSSAEGTADQSAPPAFIGKVRWVEISTECERARMQALSEELAAHGIPNEVSFIECGVGEFGDVLLEAQDRFDQIRIGGELRDLAPKFVTRLPSQILTLRSIDAFVKEDGEWWPRNYLVEGLGASIAEDLKNLDFTGVVIVIGAGADGRAAVASFVRVGFNRVNIVDTDDERAEALVEDLRRSFFSVQFQAVSRHRITQLPSVHSVAVNTLAKTDEAFAADLFYLNFLKAGGVWLDLPLVSTNGALTTEARGVEAVIESSAAVLDRVDRAWARACFGALGARLSSESYRARLERISQSSLET